MSTVENIEERPIRTARAAKLAAQEKLKIQQLYEEEEAKEEEIDEGTEFKNDKALTYRINHTKQTSLLLKLPLEILVKIGLFLSNPHDAIFLSSTCKHLQGQLGRKNKHFWYLLGNRAKAPQDAFQMFNNRYDYRGTIIKVVSGAVSRKICQVCFGIENVKCIPSLNAKCCESCFPHNVIHLSHIIHIPNIDVSTLYTETVNKPFLVPADILLTRQSPVYIWETWYRRVAFKPYVRRRVEWANPGKTLEESINESIIERTRHERAVLDKFEQTQDTLCKFIWKRLSPWRTVVKSFPLAKHVEREKLIEDMHLELMNKVRRCCVSNLAQQYADAMDSFTMPQKMATEWKLKASDTIGSQIIWRIIKLQ